MNSTQYDLCVIGGGINGTGIARDAAGRGLSVLLLEKGDLGGATSSRSTKLIHGGLRYLEQYEFKLVAEALNERERLLRSAPHIIWPLTFILPHAAHLRPAWMIRIGLFLYDHLGKREKLHGSKSVDLKTHIAGRALKPMYKKAFAYSDCWVEDARMVTLNALDAHEKGADVKVRTECTGLKPADDENWAVSYKDLDTGESRTVQAKCVVNAAGPWVRKFLDDQNLAQPHTMKTRYAQGSHIVTKKIYDGDHAYILQREDGRIVFAIPYENDYTLIGTTDHIYEGDPGEVKITDEEIEYLCQATNDNFKVEITPKDVIWAYSGVRPLLDSGDASLSQVTRGYKLDLETVHGPPVLNVFGGKLTTFRKLSEHAVDKIASYFADIGPAWTETGIMPGGDIRDGDFEAFMDRQEEEYPWLSDRLRRRLGRAYGTRMGVILEGAEAPEDLGAHYGDGVYEAELAYLIDHEWVREADDFLWRRSKLGLHVSEETKKKIEEAISSLLRQRIDSLARKRA